MRPPNIIDQALRANLAALADGLHEAASLADLASTAMHDGNRNLAIGTIIPLQDDLPAMTGLLAAVLALNRRAE